MESCEEGQICVQLIYIGGTEIRNHIYIFLLDDEDFVNLSVASKQGFCHVDQSTILPSPLLLHVPVKWVYELALYAVKAQPEQLYRGTELWAEAAHTDCSSPPPWKAPTSGCSITSPSAWSTARSCTGHWHRPWGSSEAAHKRTSWWAGAG